VKAMPLDDGTCSLATYLAGLRGACACACCGSELQSLEPASGGSSGAKSGRGGEDASQHTEVLVCPDCGLEVTGVSGGKLTSRATRLLGAAA